LKESIYKAIHPLIYQWVSYRDTEVIPNFDGTVTVVLNSKNYANKQFSGIKANWRKLNNDFFLTSSSAMIK